MAFIVDIRRAGVLRGVRLRLPSRGTVVVLGPNGAGKTTLLKTIAGVVPADAVIVLDGVELHKLPPSRRRVGYVPQSLALFRHMSVYDNIAYGPRARGLPEEEVRRRVLEAAKGFGVAHLLDKMPWMLSGGEQQRVALARAMAAEARILLLDEAFDHIDPATREALMRLVARHAEEKGLLVILVTHHPREAFETMDVRAVVRLRAGRLEALERPEPLEARA